MLTQPIKRHGGKHYLADWIISHMPPHTRYVEPYFGGGSVLLRKPCEGVAEFAGDADGELANFWTVLASPALFGRFYRIVQAIPLGKPAFEWAKAQDGGGIVTRAVAFFVRSRQSRQGLLKDFMTPSSRRRRGMNENVSAWLTAVDGLAEVHARLLRVEVRNDPALKLITELDSTTTLFYLDPPYLHETRSSVGEYGLLEMTELDHKLLLDALNDIEGKFILSGYPSKLYDFVGEMRGWRRVEREIDNKASSGKVKAKKTECLWMNFPEVA